MSNPYPAHEGLQAAPDRAGDPEVYYGETAPEMVPADAPKYTPPVSSIPPKRWCGMRQGRALLVLIVVALVVIGAVVGGIVGGIQARNNSSSSATISPSPRSTTSSTTSPSPSSTTTTVSTSSTIITSTTSTSTFAIPTSGILALNCPAINNTQYTSQIGSSSYSFELYCMVDFVSSTSNIAESLEYSLDSCVDRCGTYNNANRSPPCQGLTFDADLTAYKGANCFLKTAITSKVPYKSDQEQASALLLN